MADTLLFKAAARLKKEIQDVLEGRCSIPGISEEQLTTLCKVVDYWLADDTNDLIDRFGLMRLAQEIKRDYVLASFLAWRGEFKLAYVTIRSFLESFCLLLYYLNQGCDRLLYLKGQGYKLMLHRMAQKRPVQDDMHAFRRHYHLLIQEATPVGGTKLADQFFEEIDDCYNTLSRAVHGDFAYKEGTSQSEAFLSVVQRVLVICNTLALHDPILDKTDDDLKAEMNGVLNPCIFQGKTK